MKDYRKHVERILYNYPALLAAVEVEPLQIAAGADPGEMTARSKSNISRLNRQGE